MGKRARSSDGSKVLKEVLSGAPFSTCSFHAFLQLQRCWTLDAISIVVERGIAQNASRLSEASSRLQAIVGLPQRLWISSVSSLFQEFQNFSVDCFRLATG